MYGLPGHKRVYERLLTRYARQLPPTSLQVRNLRPLAARLAGDRRPRQLGAAGFHHERVLERIPRSFDVGRRRLLAVVAHVIAHEMARDAELHVGFDELVVGDVELRDQRFETVLAGEEMKMR